MRVCVDGASTCESDAASLQGVVYELDMPLTAITLAGLALATIRHLGLQPGSSTGRRSSRQEVARARTNAAGAASAGMAGRQLLRKETVLLTDECGCGQHRRAVAAHARSRCRRCGTQVVDDVVRGGSLCKSGRQCCSVLQQSGLLWGPACFSGIPDQSAKAKAHESVNRPRGVALICWQLLYAVYAVVYQ